MLLPPIGWGVPRACYMGQWRVWVMSARDATTLTWAQEVFLEWLVDPRPAKRVEGVVMERGLIAGDSPLKGSRSQLAEALGVEPHTLDNWRRSPVFQAALRERVRSELLDETHMMDVVRNIRSVAKGDKEESSATEQIRAADLYSRLVGYQAPAQAVLSKPAQELSDEELEAAAAEEGRRPKRRLSLVEAIGD